MATLYIIMEGNGRQMEGTERRLARPSGRRTDATDRLFFTIVARFLPRQQRSLSPSPLFVRSLTDSGSVFRRDDSAPVKYEYKQNDGD